MLSNVPQISTKKYIQQVADIIRSKGNLVVIGKAGVGKTEIAINKITTTEVELTEEEVKNGATKRNFKYIYLNLSVLELGDFIGLPGIDKETGRAKYYHFDFMPLADTMGSSATTKHAGVKAHSNSKTLENGEIDQTQFDHYVLLIDELDKAKQELQNPLLELLQFRRINGQPINVDAIICTSNKPDEGAFSKQLSHALTNRCRVYVTHTDANEWLDWATNHGKVNPLITAFIHKNAQYLDKQKPSQDVTSYTNPSPRAWTYASKDIAGYMDDLNSALKDDKKSDHKIDVAIEMICDIISGRVGEEASVQFKVWVVYYQELMPAVEKLVHEGKQPDPAIFADSPDKMAVFCVSACNELNLELIKHPDWMKKSAEIEQAKEKIKVMSRNINMFMQNAGTEYAIMAIRTAIPITSSINKLLATIPDFNKMVSTVYNNSKK